MPSLMKTAILITAVALAIASGFAAVQSAQSPEKRITPAEVKWPASSGPAVGTSGVAGVQTVLLKGDPSKPGLYTLLLRAGPNMKIQAHSHRDDRIATVVSGKWYFGYGKEFNEAGLKELPPGSFYTEPPGVAHFAMTKGEGAIVQITGTGPSDTVYVDPHNDPARK
jgi:quercetin dioxygenase-like cupin family protein